MGWPSRDAVTSLRAMIDEWKHAFDSCNFIKLEQRRRSRRKGDVNKENRAVVGTAQAGGKSATIGSETPGVTRKSPSEMGICDSVDEQMLLRLTALPPGMDKNEWLATHTLSLFENVNALCGTMTELCTPVSCPIMSYPALSLFENVNALCGTMTELCTPVSCPIMSYPGVPKAHWVDERRKHHLYSAMQYIDCVMSLCETSSKDEQLFPTKYGSVFAGNFESHCRRLVRLLWHCCGHLYSKHWEQLAVLNLRAQCSLVLAHMHIIAKMYALLDSKELSALSHTLQLVRPVIVLQPCGGQGRVYSTGMSSANAASRCSRVPSSKSGSWGGHPTPAVLACKPYAQTC
ncbi:MOB kinase activator-like 2 [Toxocara canis]|uniref:MOB kinase activator-like 2 n=1 Tax=Toxocara canis TaxID=6265 RepID=A0A0B2VK12_TOXCA|nr:MOB kinase activator-like 2 [Toxocara canis]